MILCGVLDFQPHFTTMAEQHRCPCDRPSWKSERDDVANSRSRGFLRGKRLFGRQHDIALLRDIYTSVLATRGDCTSPQRDAAAVEHTATASNVAYERRSGSARLLLLEGPHGVGKRSLAQSLQRADVGLFISGRFSKVDKASNWTSGGTGPPKIPARHHSVSQSQSALFDAVRNLFDVMDETTLQTLVQDDVLNKYFAAPSDLELIHEILAPMDRLHVLSRSPEREILGTAMNGGIRSSSTNSAIPPFSPTLTTPRASTTSILARLVGAVSTIIPLVVSLDHAEEACQDDLEALLGLLGSDSAVGEATRGLLIVLSVNDDVEPCAALKALLARTNEHCTSPKLRNVDKLVVTNLAWDDLYQWVQEWCRHSEILDDKETRRLTDVVHRQTKGNPLHVHFLLQWLEKTQASSEGNVNTFLDTLSQNGLPARTDSVLSLFQMVLDLQDPLVQTVVDAAAALLECSPQCEITSHILEMVLQQPCIEETLAVEACHILDCQHGRYHFGSVALQTTAYQRIPASKRTLLHLRIGRRIWKNSSLPECLEDVPMLFTVAQQLYAGVDLVTDAVERNMIVHIQWEAGKKAMQTGAFSIAASYFELAISILGDTVWATETYDISLALYNGAAEACYSSGDFASMDRMLDAVFDKARSFQDKLQAHTTLVFANGSRNRYQEAVDTAFHVLNQLDEPLPLHPSKLDVFLEYQRLRCLLRGKSNRYFSGLPTATDSNKIAAMTMLVFTFVYAYPFNPRYSVLAMFSLIRLAIRHGMSGAAAFAISGYGLMLVVRYERFQEGYRFGQIAVDLLDRAESKAWLARIYFMSYGVINPWIRPFRESVEPLRLAQRFALKTGDIEASVICAWLQVMMTFHIGSPLASLEQEASSLYHLMKSLGQASSLGYLLPLCHLTGTLSGLSSLRLDVDGKPSDSQGVFNLLENEENKQMMAFHALCRTILYSHTGEYLMAMDEARKALNCTTDKDFSIDFYEGLSCLAAVRDKTVGGWTRRRALLAKGRRSVKRLKRYAVLCPANFRNKRDLLMAELECIRGRPFKALALFEEAIRAAKCEGFVQEEGLAYERLAQYHCFLGHPHTAIPFFGFARDAYSRWGAHTLVRRMDALMLVELKE